MKTKPEVPTIGEEIAEQIWELEASNKPYSQVELASLIDNHPKIKEALWEGSHEACPCLHMTPCRPDCTCVNHYSSCGCARCCSYGSKEQQVGKAILLARFIEEGTNKICGVASDQPPRSPDPNESYNKLARSTPREARSPFSPRSNEGNP